MSVAEVLAAIGGLALRGAEYAMGQAELRVRLLDEQARARRAKYAAEREAIERIRKARENERETYG